MKCTFILMVLLYGVVGLSASYDFNELIDESIKSEKEVVQEIYSQLEIEYLQQQSDEVKLLRQVKGPEVKLIVQRD